MKRFGTTERAGLVLAALFIVFGIYSLVHPTEAYVSHSSSGWPPKSVIGPDPPREHVTRRGARIYGVISLAFGAGIGWVALYRPRRKAAL